MRSMPKMSVFPTIAELRTLTQSIAMLDAVISPEWQYRYYSFDANWGTNEMVASMRDGSGDHYFILFCSSGAILKGFVHDVPMSPYAKDPPCIWPGVIDAVPSEFSSFLKEPAFSLQDTTFCIWRKFVDSTWQSGDIDFPDATDPDGSNRLLSILESNPGTYHSWAEEYYERTIKLSAIEHVFKGRALTQAIVSELNPDLTLEQLALDIQKIGYSAGG